MSRPSDQIIVIQYLRGIAAALIVFFHVTIMTSVVGLFPFHFGQFGVDIFFVISGFVMWTTTEHQQISPVTFWRLRVARIVPLYWIATSLFILGAVLFPGAILKARIFDAAHLIKSYFFIPAYDPVTAIVNPIYPIGWTLQYEMFFYFLFGLGLLINNRIVRAAVIFAVFFGLVWAGFRLQSTNALLATYTNPIILEFAAGIAVAILRKPLFNIGALAGAAILVSGGAMIALATLNVGAFSGHLTSLGCTLLVAGALGLERLARHSPSKFFELLGDASYSVYLFHPMVQRVAFIALTMIIGRQITTSSDLPLYTATVFTAGIIGGIVFYLLVEKPILNILRKRRARSRDSIDRNENRAGVAPTSQPAACLPTATSASSDSVR